MSACSTMYFIYIPTAMPVSPGTCSHYLVLSAPLLFAARFCISYLCTSSSSLFAPFCSGLAQCRCPYYVSQKAIRIREFFQECVKRNEEAASNRRTRTQHTDIRVGPFDLRQANDWQSTNAGCGRSVPLQRSCWNEIENKNLDGTRKSCRVIQI